MCGRYTAAKEFGELIKLVGVVMARVPFFAPRYNIAPTPPGSDAGRQERALKETTLTRTGNDIPWV